MPRTRTAFASKAFTDTPWSFPQLCGWCIALGSIAAVGLALLFAVLS